MRTLLRALGSTQGTGANLTSATDALKNTTQYTYVTAGTLAGVTQSPFGVVLANLVNGGTSVDILVNALETAGLVQRRAEPADRRRQRLVPSPAGRRALRSADALLAERLTALLEGLPRPEVDALARALPVVEAAFSGSAPPRRPPPPRGRPPRPPASRRGGA